ncbi:hypothetical protein THAOC_35000 [Thalassiosira oceanica]|uniref:Phospholipid/glycerol acyltransferase domain-containing protein n=1 Tax=Thalassiosira oceanica TaxID=159749 RepID=K0R415_THAOC|nr:hypothetical protein THAOC_35000 [Thalassiosira oceanica]|eukprot:EJK46339.1 hypothetical protein THAOC_35000 [Thalassiosira oceanica]
MALSMTVPDSNQLKSIFDIVTRTRVTTAQELRDVVTSMADGFGILADRLPAEVIEHRVTNWLNVGSLVVHSRLEKLQVPTLVIGGDEDNMLPTKEECDRLVEIMPNCTAMSVKDAGHFILDDRLNLTEAIMEAPFDPFGLRRARENYNPITDWKTPTDEAIQEAIDNRVKGLRDVLSPKFFSTSADGRRSVGLGQVPNSSEGPMLFVANHQLLGLDLGLIIAELLERRGIAARGLAHPVVFAGGNGFGGGAGPTGPRERVTKRNRDGPVDRRPGDFETFGAVMVTPKNFYKLMETNQTALLFPGGVREVFHRKGEDYDLFWPEDKADFVRVAARFNATIVSWHLRPVLNFLAMLNNLWLRSPSQQSALLTVRIYYWILRSWWTYPSASVTDSGIVPRIPLRLDSIRATRTSSLQTCMSLYSEVKSELRRGLDDLIVARETDPFKDFAARLAVERLSGKQAPTFSIDELNK